MTTRLQEIGWVRAHLDDLESDLSVLHRIDDMHAMPSAQFFRFAERSFAYQGVMRMRAEQEQQREDPPQAPQSAPARTSRPTQSGMSVTELMIVNPGLVEKVQVPS